MKKIFVGMTSLLLSGCLGYPEGVLPVKDFELNRYLGTWYEIARLDHSFERGLEKVTAEYSMRDDGGVRIINRGFSPKEQEWNEAEGKAYFVEGPGTGHLKVSFFGPFYGSYVIFDLDKDDYRHAYVTSRKHSYLWFLSRTPKVTEPDMARFIAKATSLGFETNDLIYVNQE